jgi:hypothetical protein
MKEGSKMLVIKDSKYLKPWFVENIDVMTWPGAEVRVLLCRYVMLMLMLMLMLILMLILMLLLPRNVVTQDAAH